MSTSTEEISGSSQGSIPIFFPVRPPSLKRLDKAEILLVVCEWDQYTTRIEECDPKEKFRAVSVNSCLRKEHLTVIKFVGGPSDEINDDYILEFMKKMDGGENREYRPNLESLFNTLNMDVKKDPQDKVHFFPLRLLKVN